MKISKAETQRGADFVVLRTIEATKVALPGRFTVLESIIDTIKARDLKQRAKEAFSLIKKVSRHTCKWIRSSYSTNQINEHCQCGDSRSRTPTKVESREIKADFKKMMSTKRADSVHYVWHAFAEKFLNKDGTWKYTGYDFIGKVERWAKYYPNDVIVSYSDDDSYMSSTVLYITHKTKTAYHGTTILPISQNGNVPVRTFLYPSHHNQMIDALLKIRKMVYRMDGWSSR